MTKINKRKGKIRMKFWRKITSAVMLTTLCCSMIVPVVANAAINCTSHTFVIEDTNQIILKSDHNYLHATIVNPDGSEEQVWKNCRVTTTEYYESKYCSTCGYPVTNEFVKRVIHHAACGQPDIIEY